MQLEKEVAESQRDAAARELTSLLPELEKKEAALLAERAARTKAEHALAEVTSTCLCGV